MTRALPRNWGKGRSKAAAQRRFRRNNRIAAMVREHITRAIHDFAHWVDWVAKARVAADQEVAK